MRKTVAYRLIQGSPGWAAQLLDAVRASRAVRSGAALLGVVVASCAVRLGAVLWGLVVASCAPELAAEGGTSSRAGGSQELQWSLGDERGPEAGAAFQLSPPLPVGQVPLVFEGELDERAQRTLRRGDLTEELRQRRRWLLPTGDGWWRPSRWLTGGRTHTFWWPEGEAVFVPQRPAVPQLRRVWPPVGWCAPDGAVYCLAGGAPDDGASQAAERSELFPGVGAALLKGSCMWMPRPQQGLPPSQWGGVPVEPSVLAAASCREPAAALTCEGEEQEAPGLCWRELPDGLYLRASQGPLFAAFRWGSWERWFTLARGEAVWVLPPVPTSNEPWVFWARVAGGTTELRGKAQHHAVARLRFVEVYGNPLGDEGRGEWVELRNLGTAPASLEGWQLEDQGGAVALPARSVAPGEAVLLVAEKFEPAEDLDPTVSPEVPLLRLPSLGVRGLANGGERLRLLNGSGVVQDSWPAGAFPEGQSLCRDDVAGELLREAVRKHEAPGGSPGAFNRCGAP